MMPFFKYLFRFIVLILVQVLILNNIQFLQVVNPYLYVLFIITLPLSVARPLALIIGFALGLSIDIFTNTLGVHTFATVLAAFIQKPLGKLFAPREDNKTSELVIPSMASFGRIQFMKFATLIVFCHHTALFVVEAFSFNNPLLILLRILSSSGFTILLIFIIEFFSIRKSSYV